MTEKYEHATELQYKPIRKAEAAFLKTTKANMASNVWPIAISLTD
jgi:hypothetical protein